jgi:hypothetical protein
MWKGIASVICILIIAGFVAGAAYWSLQDACSAESPLIKIQSQTKPNGADNHAEGGDSSEQRSDGNKEETKNPKGTFELRVTDRNKIEGSYSQENANGEKGDWGHKFICEIKITDFLIALFTCLLVLIGAWQGVQLKRTVDNADLHDRILERAYLWPGPGQSEKIKGDARRFYITVHNTGKTAGIITDTYCRISTEDEFKGGNLIFPGFNRENVIPPDGKEIRTGAWVDLVGSTPQIIHGYIVYWDVFKEQKRFCYWKHRVKPDGNSDPLPGCYTDWT